MTTRARLVTVGVLAGAMASAGCVAACSGTDIPAAGILLAVDTNLKVPDDIDSIGISVAGANDGGVSEDNVFQLAPGGSAKFPATLAILRGTDKPLLIRAVGYKNGAAIAMREAVTTLPADHVALLNLELNWLDKPLVSGTTAEAVHAVTTSCLGGEGPVAGSCASFELDSTTLGTFEPTAVAPSDGAAAVDVDGCFGDAQTVTPDPASCTFAPPPGVTSAAQINVALVPAPGHTAGWCSASTCVVPLPNDPLEGWSLGSDGAIHLPPAACSSAAVKAILVVPATASCPVLSSSHPARQVYGTDGGATVGPLDAGDATMPGDASGGSEGGDATTGDAADAAEAGPPPTPYASSALTNIVSIATDGTTLYALVAPPVGAAALPMVVAELPLDFVDGTTPTRVTLPSAALVAPGATVASAAGSGLYVFSNVGSASTFASLQVISLDQPTVTTPFVAQSSGGTFTDLDIADSGANSALLTFVEPGSAYGTTVGAALFTKGQSSLAYVAPSAPGLVASGRYTPAAGGPPRYVFGGTDGGVFSAATYSGALTTERFLSGSEPYAFAYANGALQTLLTAGPVAFSTGSESVNPGKSVPDDFTGSANVVAWVSRESQDVAYAVFDGGVFTESPYPALLPDGGIPTAVLQLFFAGQELVWSDAVGVHRTLASTLPH